MKDIAGARIDSLEGRLVALSHRIHAHPEIAWQETNASAWVAAELAGVGFNVKTNLCGLPTAFAATVGSGSLHLGICAEYDALAGLGHACGHNIIAAAAVGAAAALAPVVDALDITLTVFGTPAEEGGGGKIELLDGGAFDGVHAAMMVHPGPLDVARAEPYAVSHSKIRYRGKASHAGAYPERGINAADAFTVAQVAIGLLRQQLESGVRVHGVVTSGGEAPNAIPEVTEGRWYVRAGSLADLAVLEAKVRRCFEAGALSTGCELEIEAESKPYAEFATNEAILDRYVANAIALGRTFTSSGPDMRMNRASTDMGNVSQMLPAIHPYIGIESLPAVNHQREFAAACITAAADRAVLDAAKAMAHTCIDLAADSRLRARLISRGAARLSPNGPGIPLEMESVDVS
ncbi:M20 family metallopeptidase [Paenarthrobacter sp. PH39-S1]|uniref:M20 family metallopeptidase n=1 Tax=Paenarthrobacter sp. PH39-S1 TaxID=3046204 RepID=UPI0024B89249|nr:M20 family metallopeptidase [Paenarthrobacter sp. PH39-S1]MDJ0357509.1 M20 family metallopeptidase [Paenarthrobacter sp. PH39-S1]